MKDEAKTLNLTASLLDSWCAVGSETVALHLRQKLVSVEGAERAVVFPPTYANIGYNVDELADGTWVATIDSVGSQANRMEPLFLRPPLAELVPQVSIEIRAGLVRSLLELAHRSADATVYACEGLREKAEGAFARLAAGDAWDLCCLAPTSLVFGVWDSRGGSGQKRQRLVRSVIRAWDVRVLHSAAQFNSVWKGLDEEQREELEAAAKAAKKKVSDIGLKDAPAVFRKVGLGAAKEMREWVGGGPNPERRVLGGVLAGEIIRDVTVNLVALRAVPGGANKGAQMRKYLLGIALLAATADLDWNLREGCNLRLAHEGRWSAVARRGEPSAVSALAGTELLDYARAAAEPLKPDWPKDRKFRFDAKLAKGLFKKKVDGEGGEEE
ncbi:MAG: type I-G CRISPR-associated RAMP protein Csb1/Cas7g [Terriglobales bacterium]